MAQTVTSHHGEGLYLHPENSYDKIFRRCPACAKRDPKWANHAIEVILKGKQYWLADPEQVECRYCGHNHYSVKLFTRFEQAYEEIKKLEQIIRTEGVNRIELLVCEETHEIVLHSDLVSCVVRPKAKVRPQF